MCQYWLQSSLVNIKTLLKMRMFYLNITKKMVVLGSMLPWGPNKGAMVASSDADLRPGEYVMRLLFTEFTVQAERKMEAVMAEALVRDSYFFLQ